MFNKYTEYILPEITDSEEAWKNFITQLIDKECEEVLHKINSDPLLQNITTPKQVENNLWKQISEYEKSGHCLIEFHNKSHYKSIEFDRFKTETGAPGRIANKKID